MSVQKMNNHELELNLKKLVMQEREILHEILLHIQQVEVRRIYLDRAYSSIYEYLTKELNYSGSAAMRRIEAARLLKQIPSISSQIESGDLNLSQIGELSKAFKEREKQSGLKLSLSEKKEILVKVSGKSVAETQKEVSKALDLNLAEPEKAKFQKDESVLLSITFTKEQYEKLNRCRDKSVHKLSQEHKGYGWAEVIENLMDQLLDEETLSAETNEKVASLEAPSKGKAWDEGYAKENSNTATVLSCVNKQVALGLNRSLASEFNKLQSSNINRTLAAKINKTLTSKTKNFVIKRDRCCQYVDKKSGRQCESTFGLEVDHITPRFAGGGHDLNNLQALCKKHNIYRYHRQAQIRFL